jgi:hypothetical protein
MMIRPIWWSRKPTVIEVNLRGRPPVRVVEPGAGAGGRQTKSGKLPYNTSPEYSAIYLKTEHIATKSRSVPYHPLSQLRPLEYSPAIIVKLERGLFCSLFFGRLRVTNILSYGSTGHPSVRRVLENVM